MNLIFCKAAPKDKFGGAGVKFDKGIEVNQHIRKFYALDVLGRKEEGLNQSRL